MPWCRCDPGGATVAGTTPVTDEQLFELKLKYIFEVNWIYLTT